MSAAGLSPLPRCFMIRKNLQPNWRIRSSSGGSERRTPRLLKLAVSGVTELLRLFAPEKKTDTYTLDYEQSVNGIDDVSSVRGVDDVSSVRGVDGVPSVRGVDDVIRILKSDYQRAYFLTGKFTSAIYVDDCLFEDPTIKFRGQISLSYKEN